MPYKENEKGYLYLVRLRIIHHSDQIIGSLSSCENSQWHFIKLASTLITQTSSKTDNTAEYLKQANNYPQERLLWSDRSTKVK